MVKPTRMTDAVHPTMAEMDIDVSLYLFTEEVIGNSTDRAQSEHSDQFGWMAIH